ncbi:MAG: N-dimethylarginine dimethylaminohydrolase [Chlamydiales bacterium]|jgi:N-dimethylarginine dimethylaminohydrolase
MLTSTQESDIRSHFPLESIMSRYLNLISRTPNFSVIKLQKSIDKEREIEKREAPGIKLEEILDEATELGPAIMLYLKSKGDIQPCPESLFNTLINEVSERKKELLRSSFSSEEIYQHIVRISERYQRYISRQVPDIVFRAESGFIVPVKNKKPYVFLGNYSSEHGHDTRLEEIKYNRSWFLENGYQIIEVPNHLSFEASAEIKYVKHGHMVDIVFGWGIRTSKESIEWVTDKMHELMGEDFEKVNIIPAEIITEDFYHLDTALREIPIIRNGRIIGETIMYYPQAFSEETQSLLKRTFPDALSISKEDAENFSCNSVCIGKSFIIDHRVSYSLKTQLETRGLEVIPINLSEFYKAGGGAKCLILELEEDIFSPEETKNNKIQIIQSPRGVFDVVYVNDPYMKNNIGRVNKGLAERQHQELVYLLQSHGAEIHFFQTSSFKESYDFENLRKATHSVLSKKRQSGNLKEILWEARKNFNGMYGFLDLPDSPLTNLLKEIYETYEKLLNSEPSYSWATLLQAIHEERKSYSERKQPLIVDGKEMNCPEDFFPYMNAILKEYELFYGENVMEQSWETA